MREEFILTQEIKVKKFYTDGNKLYFKTNKNKGLCVLNSDVVNGTKLSHATWSDRVRFFEQIELKEATTGTFGAWELDAENETIKKHSVIWEEDSQGFCVAGSEKETIYTYTFEEFFKAYQSR